jgi:16S rRNA (cytosine1402-N4)-methyltransferase
LAVDRDPDAVARGRALATEFGDQFNIVEGRFGDLETHLGENGIDQVDGGLVFDLGLSSYHVDDPARGFSFREDGPLNMLMGGDGPTAADIVNEASEKQLADIIYTYGEERKSRQVAAAIIAARAERPFARTQQLADVVRSVVPRSAKGVDPATRTFQALRIHVNDELGELERVLLAAERLMLAGARLVVVSFHSLEDRIVKRFLGRRARPAARPSRHSPVSLASGSDQPASFRLVQRRAVKPADAEIARNPRARSARLRAAERTTADPWREAA